MKPIKIVESNADQIEAALHQMNGSASHHTYTTYQDIERVARLAESRVIEITGSKTTAIGARYISQSGSTVAKAYKYTRATTTIMIERRSAAWYLVDVARSVAWDKPRADRILLTPRTIG